MSQPPFNCSLTKTGNPWAYNSSLSPSQAAALCFSLLDAKCKDLSADDVAPSFCADSASAATAAHVQALLTPQVCNLRINAEDFVRAYALGIPLLALFFLNLCRMCAMRLWNRWRRSSRAENAGAEHEMTMADPISETFFLGDSPAASAPADADTLGMFGSALPMFGLQWLRSPNASRARSLLRLMFCAWTVIAPVVAIRIFDNRLMAPQNPLHKKVTFLLTYNTCAQLCVDAAQRPCPQAVDIVYGCLPPRDNLITNEFLECATSDDRILAPFLRSGIIVTSLQMLLMPLLGVVFCVTQWSSPHNPVILFLHTLKRLAPDQHRVCCAAAAAVVACFFACVWILAVYQSAFPGLASAIAPRNSLFSDSNTFRCCSAFQQHTYASAFHAMLRAFSLFAVFFFLLLAPTAMVAAYAFIAFITRARFGSFVSLVHMLIATRTQPPRAAHDGEDATTQSPSDSGAAAASPLDADARRKLLQLLNICRCPDAILAQVIPAVSSAETSVSPKDVAGVLLPELQSLWMVQIRDTISLSTFHSRWLIAHAAVTLGLLVPLALYFSIGIRIFPSVNTTILVVPYLFFNLPLLAAVLMMALGQFLRRPRMQQPVRNARELQPPRRESAPRISFRLPAR